MRKILSRLSIRLQLSLILAVFLFIITVLISVSYFGLNIMSDVRAYVGGEGLWSKAQKDAVYHLMRYTIFHEERDYQQYLAYLSVPLGDRKARLALQQPNLDRDAVYTGFIAGRNHPSDIDGMARLFRQFYFISYIRNAAEAWTGGDNLLSELIKIGEEVRRDVIAERMSLAKENAYLKRIEAVNVELTPLEDKFSFILGEGARWLKKWILIGMFSLTVTLLLAGLVLAVLIGRRLVQNIRSLRHAATRIAEGDFGTPIEVESRDEIGDLAESLKVMAGQRQRAEDALAERARELDQANKKLIETEKVKDDFFATVSHELRTPLTLVLSPLETLLADGPGAVTPTQRKTLETMHNNTVRLLQMVTGLLDFSKLGAGSMEVHLEPTELVTLTKSIVSDFEPMFRQKNLRTDLEFRPEAMPVMMDRYLYERILFNLLSNAVKFTPIDGAVAVRVSYEKGRLEIEVKDTGIGISAENLKQLFQKFRQLEGASTRRFEGTGLGLALVKEFIDLLGGTIAVKSQPGVGTTFTVHCAALPAPDLSQEGAGVGSRMRIVQRFSREAVNTEESNNQRVNLPKVLIAEDSAELASYISALLQEVSRTRIAVDGEDVLRLTAEWKPDLIVSDVMMPKKDGLEVCREIKANEKTSHIPFLLVTALTHRDALLKGWEAGADEYLFKPFHPKELVTRVKSLLSGVRERRRVEDRLRQLNQELEVKVQQRTEGLQHLNEELEQFSYIASHDLKEPVRKIRTFSDLLKVEQKESLNQTSLDYIQRVQSSAVRMEQLIESLLAFSGLSKQIEKFGPVPLDDIMEEVLSDLEVAITSTAAKIKIDPLPTVEGDRVQLRQLFQNLIGNAIKFHGPGMVPEISIHSLFTGDKVEIKVSDNGIGFEERFTDLIFKPFERLHARHEFEGVGMGLTICQKIVRRHGGTISVRSAVGRGSTFTVKLRLSKSS